MPIVRLMDCVSEMWIIEVEEADILSKTKQNLISCNYFLLTTFYF